mmetsp:Transcript_3101/g.9466  ORF Transcript_3101/g.9466 Transcript_3101/m.9466 type:complete len:231 (-) Transcript_3101:376-1068(-)
MVASDWAIMARTELSASSQSAIDFARNISSSSFSVRLSVSEPMILAASLRDSTVDDAQRSRVIGTSRFSTSSLVTCGMIIDKISPQASNISPWPIFPTIRSAASTTCLEMAGGSTTPTTKYSASAAAIVALSDQSTAFLQISGTITLMVSPGQCSRNCGNWKRTASLSRSLPSTSTLLALYTLVSTSSLRTTYSTPSYPSVFTSSASAMRLPSRVQRKDRLSPSQLRLLR